MGILDDAIREHLELKRKHGVSEEELQRQEDEALGPARRDVAQQPEDVEGAAADAADAGDGEAGLFDGEHAAVAAADGPGAHEPEGGEPPSAMDVFAAEPAPAEFAPAESTHAEPALDEPAAAEPAHAEPPVADHTGLEPPPVEEPPPAAEPPRFEDLAATELPPEPAADDRARLGDTEPHGFPALHDEDDDEPYPEAPGEGDSDDEDDLLASDAEDEELDVLEDTPDFLQETPEHDRLWFEQKPPRDFDFD